MRRSVAKCATALLVLSAAVASANRVTRPYPSADQYIKAVKEKRFNDDSLKQSTPAVAGNRIICSSGQNAIAFKLELQNNRVLGVKTYFDHDPTRNDRYPYLQRFLGNANIPGLSRFAYLHDGIKVDGELYPLLAMPWIKGKSLDKAITRLVEAGDSQGLFDLAEKFRGLMKTLNEQGIAHGDLQEGNIRVTENNEIELIDYDDMFVPGLEGFPARGKGLPNYQHHQRDGQFDSTLDHFPSLVIYSTLLAVAHKPEIWTRNHDEDDEKRLLFTTEDYNNPLGSSVVAEVMGQSDVVKKVVKRMLDSWREPFFAVPTLEETLGGTLDRKYTPPSPPAAEVIVTTGEDSRLQENREPAGVPVAPVIQESKKRSLIKTITKRLPW